MTRQRKFIFAHSQAKFSGTIRTPILKMRSMIGSPNALRTKSGSAGLKAKRFFVSEDPEVIKNYIVKRKEPITKIVYSSAVTGKLFNSKESVIDDFIKNQLKPIPLEEVPNQNRFQIEETFLAFIQKQLEESKINAFVEALSQHEEFSSYIDQWMEEVKEESEEEA